jgi:hypothetical protein
LLPDLERFGLVAEAGVGEVDLVFDVEGGWLCKDVHLLAVPGVVVAGLISEYLLGESIGG